MYFCCVYRGDPSIVKLNIAITTGYLISGNYATCKQQCMTCLFILSHYTYMFILSHCGEDVVCEYNTVLLWLLKLLMDLWVVVKSQHLANRCQRWNISPSALR